jgi:hypothetical protein
MKIFIVGTGSVATHVQEVLSKMGYDVITDHQNRVGSEACILVSDSTVRVECNDRVFDSLAPILGWTFNPGLFKPVDLNAMTGDMVKSEVFRPVPLLQDHSRKRTKRFGPVFIKPNIIPKCHSKVFLRRKSG